jgi:hypothetical protein
MRLDTIKLQLDNGDKIPQQANSREKKAISIAQTIWDGFHHRCVVSTVKEA